GCVTLETTSCSGLITVSAVRPRLARGPLFPSRYSTVIGGRDTETSATTTSLALRALVGRAIPLPAGRAHQDPLEHLELLQAPAGPDGHGRQWVLIDADGHPCLVPEWLAQPPQQGAPTGEHDALVHDVARELGRRPVQRGLDGIDDRRHRLVDGLADLAVGDLDGLGQAAHQVAAGDLRDQLLL